MPVDQLSGFRDVSKDRAIPLPGEIFTTPGTIDHLGDVPQEIALNPRNLTPFLASQYAKMVEITSRPEIKTLSAEIPEPDFVGDDSRLQVTALTSEEQGALGEWREEAKTLLTQSGETPLDELDNRIKGYIDEAAKTHPELYDKGRGGGSVDVLGDWFTGQMVQETEESKKKYHEILATASRGGSDAVILAMTFRHAQKQMSQMGELLNAYRDKITGLDKLQADLDLKGAKLTQSDMMKGNIDFARYQGDATQIFQIIQKTMSDYERTMVSANSLIKTMGEPLANAIRNLRS